MTQNASNGSGSSPVNPHEMGLPALKLVPSSPPLDTAGAVALKDEELMALSRAGDRDAFSDLVLRYEERALHTARGILLNAETAREVAQEAFLKVYSNRDRFDLKRRFAPWFFRILRNLAVDRLRRQAAGTPGAASELVGDWNSSVRGPLALASLDERRSAVHRILQELPAKFRFVLSLRDLEGMSCGEIGDRLALSPGTVRWRLHHARQLFRQNWERLLGREQGSSEL